MKIRSVVLICLPQRIRRWPSQRLSEGLIQKFWVEFCEARQLQLLTLEAYPSEIHLFQGVLAAADLIVLTWNGPILLPKLRTLGIVAPSISYLAGEGCRGFAYSIGGCHQLTEQDAFICVSDAEQRVLARCFPRAQSAVIPYSGLLPEEKPRRLLVVSGTTPVRLLCVGRYTQQKNLHTLFWALAILTKLQPKMAFELHLYGAEDGLGSPNMATRGAGYRLMLDKLSVTLGIQHLIRWHGYVQNDHLKSVIQRVPHVLVSPSLYSEECFGLAAFDSLIRGNFAVLSAWGGYLDLRRHFCSQVELVPVFRSIQGPFVSPFDLADRIFTQMNRVQQGGGQQRLPPQCYLSSAISDQVSRLIFRMTRPKSKVKKLGMGTWLIQVQRQIRALNPSLETALRNVELRIYEGYGDPLVHEAFRAYGMRRKLQSFRLARFRSPRAWIAPWVDISRRAIVIRDPHRGRQKLVCVAGRRSASVKVYGFKANQRKLGLLDAKWLYDRGYLFFE